jgi:hypothetical protein
VAAFREKLLALMNFYQGGGGVDTAAALSNRGAEKIGYHFVNARSIFLGHNQSPTVNWS